MSQNDNNLKNNSDPVSKTRTTNLTFRLAPSEKRDVNRAIDHIIETEEITGRGARSDALIIISERALLGFTIDSTPGSVSETLTVIECDYLRYAPPRFYCLETVAKKKEAADLGYDAASVEANCTACLRKKDELRNLMIEKLLMRQSVARIATFYKRFVKISRDGFDVDCTLCLAETGKGHIVISQDGDILDCPILENQAVAIEDVCKVKVNPDGSSPCRFLVTFPHLATLDDMGIDQTQIYDEITPTPCHSFEQDECPGLDGCTVNLTALARINKYCPHRYTAPGGRTVKPLLEAPVETVDPEPPGETPPEEEEAPVDQVEPEPPDESASEEEEAPVDESE